MKFYGEKSKGKRKIRTTTEKIIRDIDRIIFAESPTPFEMILK